MKLKSLLFLFASLLIASNLIAQDVIIIEGGLENGGLLEATINGDTTATGERVNPNRIYELKAGSFYLQHGPLIVDNPDGAITIRGQQGGAKPVIIKVPLNEVAIGTSDINSSLNFWNIQYHNMETSNALPWVAFNISGDNHHIWVEDCLIENAMGIVFNGGNIAMGAKIILRGNYFRDLNDFSQWWGARAAECKQAIDTLIIENNTFSGGGLTFLSQESVTDVAIINHNTLINNHKYPFLNQYWRELYFTNNLFVNVNMVGEDMENVATGGQDPDALMHGIYGVDTIEASLNIQPRFLDGENLTDEVNEISDYIIYAADNVVVYSTTLDNYYDGTEDGIWEDAPASYLTWGGAEGPFRVVNVPGIWENERSAALDAAYDNIKEENNHIYEWTADDLGMVTDPLPQDAADIFVAWNQAQWGVPDAVAPTDFTAYYFGDHNPQTVPGVETENSTSSGITKISDMVEDFSYTADLVSQSDGMRIGALHWNDEAFDPAASLAAIKNKYSATTTVVDIIVGSPDHDTLEAAVIAAGLADDLSGDGPFTVFAPTDEAFKALPAGIIELLLADPTGLLADVLLYHVVSGKVMSTDLSDGQVAATLLGEDITVTINGDGVFINNAKVIVADLEADNGVVHVLDAVLIPPGFTGVKQLTGEKGKLSIHPNPASDFIRIAGLKGEKSGWIKIVGVNGKVLRNQHVDNVSESINISSLNKGMYFLMLDTENASYTGKFIVE